MVRTKAREEAFLLLFQLEARGDTPDEILAENEDDYIDKVVRGVYDGREHIDGVIEAHLKDWKLDRITKVSLAAMRIAIYEIDNLDDVPIKVAIKEAVDIVNKYEGEEGANFVNGLLGQLQKRQGIVGQATVEESDNE